MNETSKIWCFFCKIGQIYPSKTFTAKYSQRFPNRLKILLLCFLWVGLELPNYVFCLKGHGRFENSWYHIIKHACGIWQEVAPRYAGLLHGKQGSQEIFTCWCFLRGLTVCLCLFTGIANTVGTMGAIISTIGIGYFIQWLGSFQAFLTLTSIMYILSTLFWNLYATGERVIEWRVSQPNNRNFYHQIVFENPQQRSRTIELPELYVLYMYTLPMYFRH